MEPEKLPREINVRSAFRGALKGRKPRINLKIQKSNSDE